MNNNGYNNYGNYGGNGWTPPRQPPQKKESALPVIIVAVVAAAAILFGVFAAIYAVRAIKNAGSGDKISVQYSVPDEDADAGDAAAADTADADDAGEADGAQPAAGVVVEDAYSEDIDYGSGTVTVRIPQIDVSGGDAERINEEIYDSMSAEVEACKDSIDEDGWPTVSRMEYRTYENGDILSLVIECEDENDYTEYTVYNISISTGAELTADDILAAVGCSEEEYLAGVENAVEDQTLELWNQVGAGDYETQLAKSCASDNIRAAVPYLGENGELHVIVRIWGFAGAESYYYDIPAEPAEAASVDDLFEVIGGKEYLYSSGVGAWSESFTVNTDGTFSGYTTDMDMGVGLVYTCDFTGTFGNVTKISDYEYTIEVLSLDAPTFDDYTVEGMTRTYTTPYGIAQGMTFHVYLPGMAIADMPSEYLEFGSIMYAVEGLEIFPFCGLYASDGGCYGETSY